MLWHRKTRSNHPQTRNRPGEPRAGRSILPLYGRDVARERRDRKILVAESLRKASVNYSMGRDPKLINRERTRETSSRSGSCRSIADFRFSLRTSLPIGRYADFLFETFPEMGRFFLCLFSKFSEIEKIINVFFAKISVLTSLSRIFKTLSFFRIHIFLMFVQRNNKLISCP